MKALQAFNGVYSGLLTTILYYWQTKSLPDKTALGSSLGVCANWYAPRKKTFLCVGSTQQDENEGKCPSSSCPSNCKKKKA